MSLETLLTLGATTGILVLAALLRFVVLGIVRLGLRLSGRQVWWLQRTPRERATGRDLRERRPLWPRVVRGARSAAAASWFLVAGVAEGLGIAAVGLARGSVRLGAAVATGVRGALDTSADAAVSTTAWLGPRLRRAGRRSRRVVGAGISRVKPAVVLTVATVQHFSTLLAARAEAWLQEHQAERSARPGEPTAAGGGPRVIDLDRDFDPLTDDFPEDRIGSSA